MREILSGGREGAIRDAVALNAGAAFYIAGRSRNLADGVTSAQEILKAGTAAELITKLAKQTSG